MSLNEVRSDLSAGSGRWHPVIQLRFPLACAVCSPLSSADLAISSPKEARAQGGRRISHSNPVFCVLGPSEGARAGCNPWLLLQDSQTCRHPTPPSPLSTRVERSVGSDRLPPNPIKMTPNLLPSFQKKQANVSSPHEKRKKNSSLGYTPWKNRTAVQSKPRKGAQPPPGDTLPSPRTDGPFAADVSGSPGLFSSHSRAVQTAIRPACGGTVLKILQ